MIRYLEYDNTLRTLEQEEIPKWLIDWIKVYLIKSKIGKTYNALIYPAFSTFPWTTQKSDIVEKSNIVERFATTIFLLYWSSTVLWHSES